MNLLKVVSVLALAASAVLAQSITPQGRLTLTSNTPVMTSDSTGATSVYYTPYIGNQIPIYNGTSFANNTFSQLTMTLNTSNQLNGCVYDLFVFLNSGTVTIGAGPAWGPSGGSCSTTSRNTGAGTTELTQLSGFWVNANSVTLTNGTTSYSSIAADKATYVGSIYMTANGQTSMQLKPSAASAGTSNVLGVWNAYNRVATTAFCRDTNSWSYSTASWRAADNSTTNRISFLDGLQQSQATGDYSIMGATSSNATGEYIGLNEDSSTTTPNIAATMASSGGQPGANQISVTESFYPKLGLHYIQAVEYATGSVGSFFGTNGSPSQQMMALAVTLDM